ncbi:hypothetical protein [Bryobacter aggregatus]|uniref:hypothetical protein n=1 Tax=Bryobacter aggregatus TaxID=360054 RepID=UPI00068FDE7C|nr:hypothetical protein [Bryobacter aggregatus]
MHLLLVWRLLSLAVDAGTYRSNLPLDHPAIDYRHQAASNRVESLGGSVPQTLAALLSALEISPDSQTLVFSKTSFVARQVSPKTPRAIYFNDDTYLAWTQPAAIEIATVDARLGMAFYTVREGKLERQTQCLSCHQTAATMGVPGVFVGSVLPNANGVPAHGEQSIITSPDTPFRDRWGGWYVDRVPDKFEDRSNSWAIDPSDTTQLTKMLSPVYEASRYLRPGSDPIALLTLEHQTTATNLLTRLAWEDAMANPDPRTLREVIAVLSYAGERRLPQPLAAPSAFRAQFEIAGLRSFDLREKVFRYPLSYLLASGVFLRLRSPLRHEIYEKISTSEAPGLGDALDILQRTSEDFRLWRENQIENGVASTQAGRADRNQ